MVWSSHSWSGVGLEFSFVVWSWSGVGLELVCSWSGVGLQLVWSWSGVGLAENPDNSSLFFSNNRQHEYVFVFKYNHTHI